MQRTERAIRAVAQVARPVLLYSGGWRFCRWAARIVAAIDLDEQLALLPLADQEAGHLLATVPEDRRTECWWLVRRDGIPVAGDQGGGIALLTEMQVTRTLGRALGAVALAPLIDALDTSVARYRKPLSSFVPDGPAPRRYP